MDPQLFEGEGQSMGGLFNRQLGLSGPVLPQIPLTVASEVPQVDESAGRPVRQQKRSRVAFEVENEPVILRVSGRKRQKRTG